MSVGSLLSGFILGLYLENGKQNGNYFSILGLYWENGKYNGNYYLGFRVWSLGVRFSLLLFPLT